MDRVLLETTGYMVVVSSSTVDEKIQVVPELLDHRTQMHLRVGQQLHGRVERAAGDWLLAGREFAWLSTGGRCGHEALGITPDEFDSSYAYPWPDEERLLEDLFEARARPGALLLTYHGEQGLWLRRKGEGR
jgi:hypothetical protein